MRSQITPSPPIIDPYGQRLLDLLRLHECSLHRIRRHISLNLISYLRSGFKGFNTGNWIMGWTGRTSLHGPFGPLIHFLCSTFCSHALVLSIPSHPKNVHRKSQRIGPVNSFCGAHGVTLSDIHSSPLLDWCENKKIRVKQSEVWTLSRVRPADCILDAQRGLPLLHARWITDRKASSIRISFTFLKVGGGWRAEKQRIDGWPQDIFRVVDQ